MKYTAVEKLSKFKAIIKEVEKGSSVRAATRIKENIDISTFYKWLAEDEELAKLYARATERRAEAIFEDMLNIADENYKDTYIDENGIERTDHDVVQRSKLRIDTRKWMLAKMMPRKYGDKLDITSGDKAIAVPPIIGMVIKNELTPEENEPNDDDLF